MAAYGRDDLPNTHTYAPADLHTCTLLTPPTIFKAAIKFFAKPEGTLHPRAIPPL